VLGIDGKLSGVLYERPTCIKIQGGEDLHFTVRRARATRGKDCTKKKSV